MVDIKTLTTANLRSLIDETESHLADLNDELERREQAAQHAEIDNLETHLKNAEISLTTIRDFLAELVKGVRGDNKS